MGSFSDYVEEAILNELFRGIEFTAPTTVYVGLAAAPINESDDLSLIMEEDDVDYVRKPVTFTAPVQNAGPAEIENDVAIMFEPYAADADVPVTHAFITAEQTGTTGEILTSFELVESKQPAIGEVISLGAGTIKITLA